jgi:hypothetical protein
MDYNASNTIQTITFLYDTKQNPEALLFPDNQEPTNNLTQATYQFPGSSNQSNVFTYTYIYNANGFPLTVTEKNDHGYTKNSTYSYTNCK